MTAGTRRLVLAASAALAALSFARAEDIRLEPDAAKRRTVAILRGLGPRSTTLYLYAPSPWVIGRSGITAGDTTLWVPFSREPNTAAHIYNMVKAQSGEQHVVIEGSLARPPGGGGTPPWFKATVPAVDIDWEGHAGPGHEADEDTWTGYCPITTNQSRRTKIIVRKLRDDLLLVPGSMTLQCEPADAVRFLKEDGVTALWHGASISDSETPLTLHADPRQAGPFYLTLLGPPDEKGNRPADYLEGLALRVDLGVDADRDGDIDDDDESLEENPGGLLALNCDDDNGNGVPDKDEAWPDTGGEDDLRPLRVVLEPVGAVPSGTLTLSAVSGGSGVRLWESAAKRVEVALPKVWQFGPDVTLPSLTLRMEGVGASAAPRDVELLLRYADGSFAIEDRVRVTVAGADLDVDADRDGDIDDDDELLEENPGGLAGVGTNSLTRVALRLAPAGLGSGTLTLSAASGGSRVRLWESPARTAQVPLPKTWTVGSETVPPDLYVEGLQPSAAPRDVELLLRYADGGLILEDRVRITVIKVEIEEFDRVVPRTGNEKEVFITTTPSPLPTGASVSLSIVRTSGNEGAATIFDPASAVITQSTTIKIRGDAQSWGSGSTAAPDNMELRATISGSITPCDTEDFTICAHPNGVENGPSHSPIDTATQAGMQIDITIKSESGADADLDKVDDSEQVGLSYDHSGSMIGVAPLPSSQSSFMQATTVPPDNHAWSKAYIIDRYDNHGGAGSIKKHQLDIFKCKRCGMTTPEVIPNSGYMIFREYTGAGGTKIELKTEKSAEGCSVNGYTTGEGPSATYSETVTVRN